MRWHERTFVPGHPVVALFKHQFDLADARRADRLRRMQVQPAWFSSLETTCFCRVLVRSATTYLVHPDPHHYAPLCPTEQSGLRTEGNRPATNAPLQAPSEWLESYSALILVGDGNLFRKCVISVGIVQRTKSPAAGACISRSTISFARAPESSFVPVFGKVQHPFRRHRTQGKPVTNTPTFRPDGRSVVAIAYFTTSRIVPQAFHRIIPAGGADLQTICRRKRMRTAEPFPRKRFRSSGRHRDLPVIFIEA